MSRPVELFTITADYNADDGLVLAPQGSRQFLNHLLFRPNDPAETTLLGELVWQSPVEHPPDMLNCTDGARLVSQRVRGVVSEFDHGEVSWLPARVRTPSGLLLPYWLVHYPQLREVFDTESTTYGPSGLPIRWVVDLVQVQDLPVFMVPGASDVVFIVHSVVRDALRSAGVTGMQVRRTRTRSSGSD